MLFDIYKNDIKKKVINQKILFFHCNNHLYCGMIQCINQNLERSYEENSVYTFNVLYNSRL